MGHQLEKQMAQGHSSTIDPNRVFIGVYRQPQRPAQRIPIFRLPDGKLVELMNRPVTEQQLRSMIKVCDGDQA